MQKLPIGIQDFYKIRKDGYVYLDKTRLIYNLVSLGSYYFLSRPRRFGKSLLLSTIKAFFEGKRELFKGLYIDSKEGVEWVKRPVLYLDLNTSKFDAPEVLQKKLEESLHSWEKEYGEVRSDLPLGMRFEAVIQAAYNKTGHRVAILVDEYDKPMLQAIGNEALQEEFRSTLKGFYGALKSMDGCIKFALLTGVTKFGKVSVFSDLNNLNDISMDHRYYDICGLTEEELLSTFSEDIETLAATNNITAEECLSRLREMYDGYHFEEDTQGIYNPFSVLNTFDKMKFGSYWFETGTPTYLVELLRSSDYDLENLEGAEAMSDVLNSIDSNSSNPIPVIYQSGYLTIKGYKQEFKKYVLGFPNKEVEEGFINFLAPYYLSKKRDINAFDIEKFITDVRTGNPEQFCRRLKSLYADAPYDMAEGRENYYQNIVWVVFKLLGFYSHAEYHTSDGRIDLIVESSDYRYVMEFKLNGTAEEALQQIKSKDYALPFLMDNKKTFLIGMNFSSEIRNIDKYVVEEMTK